MVSAHSLRFARSLALATTLALPACSGESTGSPSPATTTTDRGATPPAPTADASTTIKDAGADSALTDAASATDAASTPDANVDVDSGGGGGAGPLFPPSFVG
jgi:ABC-type phosphate transport system substrate-binding protein